MQKFEDINFPVFRKYRNNHRYYRIINNRELEEIQVIGTKKILHTLLAQQLPEIQLINDLIYHYHAFAEEINEEEYQRVRAHIL
jgi:hypothetical protein